MLRLLLSLLHYILYMCMSFLRLRYMLVPLFLFLHSIHVLMLLFLLHLTCYHSLVLYSDVTYFLLPHSLLLYLLSILHYKHDLMLRLLLSLLHYILYMCMSFLRLRYMLVPLFLFLHSIHVLMLLFLLHLTCYHSLVLYSDVTYFLLPHSLLLYLLSILHYKHDLMLLPLLSLFYRILYMYMSFLQPQYMLVLLFLFLHPIHDLMLLFLLLLTCYHNPVLYSDVTCFRLPRRLLPYQLSILHYRHVQALLLLLSLFYRILYMCMSFRRLQYMLVLLSLFLRPTHGLMLLFLLLLTYYHNPVLYSDVIYFRLPHRLLPYLLSIRHYMRDLMLRLLLSLLHYILYMCMSFLRLRYMLVPLFLFLHSIHVLMLLFLLHLTCYHSLVLYSDVTYFLLPRRLLPYQLSIPHYNYDQVLLSLLSLLHYILYMCMSSLQPQYMLVPLFLFLRPIHDLMLLFLLLLTYCHSLILYSDVTYFLLPRRLLPYQLSIPHYNYDQVLLSLLSLFLHTPYMYIPFHLLQYM